MPQRNIKISNSKYVDENKKICHLLYDHDTSTYEDITTNKKSDTIKLFDKFDESILNLNKDIIRNYLIRTVVYKLNKRFIEVQINQNDLYICYLKNAKDLDLDNKLSIRKGYEKSSLCYYLRIENDKDLKYAINLASDLYNYLVSPQTPICDKLFDIIYGKVMSINNNVSYNPLYRYDRFKAKRNFVEFTKTNYGLYVRLLQVDDPDNLLQYKYRTGIEPLCMVYKIKEEKDIDIIMPYIEKSYEMSNCVAIDVKSGLNSLYM